MRIHTLLTTRLPGVVLLLCVLSSTMPAQIDADFTGTPTAGGNPLTVSFTDLTTGGIPTFWSWGFGDGGTSAQQNPVHTYSGPGCYTVSLLVFETSVNIETKIDYITVDPASLVVDFSAIPTQGVNPLQVAFSDTSTGATVTGWSWDFGDGNTSALQNPTHVYTAPETTSFSVTLTAFVGQQNDTLVQTDLITVDPAPLAVDFSAIPTQGVNPLQVAFSDTSTGATFTAWNWDFGDGGSSTLQNPIHTYQVSETTTFDVTLTAFALQQSETLVKADFVTVDPAPLVPAFASFPDGGPPPLQVAFQDVTIGGITGWQWEFGDGATSVQQEPVHSYKYPGSFDISLTVSVGPQQASTTTRGAVTVTGNALYEGFGSIQDVGVSRRAAVLPYFVFAGGWTIVVRNGDTWVAEATLGTLGVLRSAFDISGDLFIGGGTDLFGGGGSVRIDRRTQTGWQQEADLSNLGGNDLSHVAIHGDTAAFVLDYSTYVYDGSGLEWQFQQFLPSAGDLALERATLLVGAEVYTRAGAVWSKQADLVPIGTAPTLFFGRHVALAGDVAVISDSSDSTAGRGAGIVYVFGRAGTVWREQARLMASDAAPGGAFGSSVAIDRKTIVVGATGTGAAYVFEQHGGHWRERAVLHPTNPVYVAGFGSGVAIDARMIMVASGDVAYVYDVP